SSPPQSAVNRLTMLSAHAAVPMSAGMIRTPSMGPADATRGVRATRAPESWKRRTTAAPMPRVPPVTSTRLSANSSADVGNGRARSCSGQCSVVDDDQLGDPLVPEAEVEAQNQRVGQAGFVVGPVGACVDGDVAVAI